MTPTELPVLILEQVIRVQSQVILDDARGENAFAGDEYIGRKQPRSVLCLPLLKQAELTGVLYLENSLGVACVHAGVDHSAEVARLTGGDRAGECPVVR